MILYLMVNADKGKDKKYTNVGAHPTNRWFRLDGVLKGIQKPYIDRNDKG